MYARECDCHCLQDGEGSLHLHHVVVLILPAENQCLGVVFILQDEVFGGGYSSKALEVQLVGVVTRIEGRISGFELADVLPITSLPPLQQYVFGLTINDGEISEGIIAGSEECSEASWLILLLHIGNEPHLLLIVFHNLSLGAVLPRIIEAKLLPQEVRVQFGQTANMLL